MPKTFIYTQCNKYSKSFSTHLLFDHVISIISTSILFCKKNVKNILVHPNRFRAQDLKYFEENGVHLEYALSKYSKSKAQLKCKRNKNYSYYLYK